MNTLLRFLALSFGCWVALSGCMSDDLSDCYSFRTVDLYFSPAGGGANDMDPADVGSLSLFLFDARGNLSRILVDDRPAFDYEDYHIAVTLADDDEEYQVVVWGNIEREESYITDPADPVNDPVHLEEMSLRVRDMGKENLTPLFYGSLPLITWNASEDRYRIEMNQNTYTVHLSARGLPEGPDQYEMILTHAYDSYTFKNEPFLATTGRSTIQACIRDESGQLSTRFHTIGLNEDCNAIIELYNNTQDEIMYEGNLITLIEKANASGAAIDFMTTHHFYITLHFNWDTMEVTVSVNGMGDP